MRILKIVQNPESGIVGIQIKEDEEYDLGDHLQLLNEFVAEKAVETHELRKSHDELTARLGKCEEELSKLSQESKAE